jgi:hypothetical protein
MRLSPKNRIHLEGMNEWATKKMAADFRQTVIGE